MDPHYHGNLKKIVTSWTHCCRYHIYCVGLRRVPSGRWHCKECAVCGSCGTQEPGGNNPDTPNAQWQHEVRMCCASMFCEEGRMGRYRKWDCEVRVTSIKMSARVGVCVCVCVCVRACTHACSHPSPLFSCTLH